MQPISLRLDAASLHQAKLDLNRLTRRASRLLLRNQQLLAKALPTAGGYAFGDVLTQQLGPLWLSNDDDWPSKHNLAKHDLRQTAGMAAVGAFAGVPASLALYAAMDSVAPGTGIALAAVKFAADQAVGCVLWQAAYFAISEPYRRTFGQFASAQWQQHQQRCAAAGEAAAGAGPAVAAC